MTHNLCRKYGYDISPVFFGCSKIRKSTNANPLIHHTHYFVLFKPWICH